MNEPQTTAPDSLPATEAPAAETPSAEASSAPSRSLMDFLKRPLPIKKILWSGLALALAGAAWTGLTNLYIIKSTQARVYEKIEDVPPRDVALVLGAQGLHLTRRLQAAAALYHAGKTRHLLVSGDNHIKSYDEPTEMKAGLIRLGVPEGAITCDYAGFRTLDSMIRAKAVFGQDRLLIVTQRFHTYRALASARRYGIDAVAFCAADVPPQWRWYPAWREVAARAVAALDLYVLHRGPKFLGPKEPILVAAQGE